MADYEERRTVIEDVPVGGRPVVQSEYDHIVHERRGISGAAIAALVIAGIAAAVLITLLITNSNRESQEAEIERERAAAARAAAQSQADQRQPQQPVVVTVPQPQSQPTTVPVPVPVPVPTPAAPSSASTEASNISIETGVTSKLLKDEQLRTHLINVKFEGGTATLTGEVPSDDLKTRAEKVAMSVNGVKRVINDITVKQ